MMMHGGVQHNSYPGASKQAGVGMMPPPPVLNPNFNWGVLNEHQKSYIAKIMQRDFYRYGIRNDLFNNGLPNNAIFKKDLLSVSESSEYKQAETREEQKEMIGEVLIEWVNCFLVEETHAPKITGMIIDLNEVDFQRCIHTLEIFRHKVSEALALIQSTVVNSSTSSSNNSVQVSDQSATLNESSIHSLGHAAQGSNSFGQGFGSNAGSSHIFSMPQPVGLEDSALQQQVQNLEEDK